MTNEQKDIREPKEYSDKEKKGVMEDGTPFMEVEIPDVKRMQEEAESGEYSDEVPIKTLRIYNSIKPQRLPYENHEEYKIRRLSIRQGDKQREAGRNIWPGYFGTATVDRAQKINEAIKKIKEKEETNEQTTTNEEGQQEG